MKVTAVQSDHGVMSGIPVYWHLKGLKPAKFYIGVNCSGKKQVILRQFRMVQKGSRVSLVIHVCDPYKIIASNWYLCDNAT